jgi:hypothetical protein
VYIWFDRKKKMFYIGSHMGSVDDGYVCGSKWMKNARRKHKADFKRRIIYWHPDNDKKTLQAEEQRWLDLIPDSAVNKRYYNGKKIATGGNGGTSRGYKHPPEIRQKISRLLKGRTPTVEHRRKLSEVRRGISLSAEHRRSLSISHKGHIPPRQKGKQWFNNGIEQRMLYPSIVVPGWVRGRLNYRRKPISTRIPRMNH